MPEALPGFSGSKVLRRSTVQKLKREMKMKMIGEVDEGRSGRIFEESGTGRNRLAQHCSS